MTFFPGLMLPPCPGPSSSAMGIFLRHGALGHGAFLVLQARIVTEGVDHPPRTDSNRGWDVTGGTRLGILDLSTLLTISSLPPFSHRESELLCFQ